MRHFLPFSALLSQGVRWVLALTLVLPAPAVWAREGVSGEQEPRPAAAAYGAEFLVNGGAEAGAAAADDLSSYDAPGWTTVLGSFTAVQYDAAGFPDRGSPGPLDRGQNFFAGGPGEGSAQALQTIDVAHLADDIDAGQVRFRLQGHFGGSADQDDSAFAYLIFKRGAASLGVSTSVGSVSATDRAGITGLLFRKVVGTVPPGTRAIDCYLFMMLTSGPYNDGYADNLSLVLTPLGWSAYMPLVGRR